jgi:single-strand DNA-binding protein
MPYNKVILLGTMTRDPQLRFTPSNIAICEFGLALNHKYKTGTGEQREEVTFIDCAAWGKLGEIINQHFAKGKQILVDGRLKQETWDDKKSGQKRSKIGVVVESFAFVGNRTEARDDDQPPAPEPTRGQPSRPAAKADPEPDEDIPF